MDTQDTKTVVITPKELSERWAVSYNHVLNMITRGEIPCFKIGQSYRILLTEVIRIEQNKAVA